MREAIIDQDLIAGENLRIVKKLWKVTKSAEFPQGLEFTVQLLHFNGSAWTQPARIDNQLHEGKPGTHIHTSGKVRWLEIGFLEAEDAIIKIGRRIINENRDCRKP